MKMKPLFYSKLEMEVTNLNMEMKEKIYIIIIQLSTKRISLLRDMNSYMKIANVMMTLKNIMMIFPFFLKKEFMQPAKLILEDLEDLLYIQIKQNGKNLTLIIFQLNLLKIQFLQNSINLQVFFMVIIQLMKMIKSLSIYVKLIHLQKNN